MIAAVRAEILRAASGTTLLAVLAFAVLVPLMLLVVGPERPGADPTLTVYSACVGSVVAAMFLGSYSVTREYYYGSLDRTLVLTRLPVLLAAKALAAAAVSAVLAVVVAASWLGITALVLGRTGSFAPTPALLPVALGSVAAAALGGVLGTAAGWITRNYYTACLLVLGVPFAVELPLLTAAPEIERLLPAGALAALVVPEGLGLGLLPPPAAAAVAAGWCAVAVIGARTLAVRRHG